MPIPDVIELFDSGAGSLSRGDDGVYQREVTLRWLLKGVASFAAAEERVKAQAPDVWDEFFRQRLDVQPLGNQWWIGTATYVNPSASASGDDQQGGGENLFPASVSFDTSGGQEHITNARWDGTRRGYRAHAAFNLEPPDYEGALNVSGDQVSGIDIVVPLFNFTETWTVPVQMLTDSYVQTLYSLSGSVNSDRFRVFEPGECLFLGARGEATRGDFRVPLTFSFSARPNENELHIGGIGPFVKKGWEYVWIEYENAIDNANLIKRPKFAFVNEIYPLKNFADLRIGTDFPSLYQPAPTGPAIGAN